MKCEHDKIDECEDDCDCDCNLCNFRLGYMEGEFQERKEILELIDTFVDNIGVESCNHIKALIKQRDDE